METETKTIVNAAAKGEVVIAKRLDARVNGYDIVYRTKDTESILAKVWDVHLARVLREATEEYLSKNGGL